MQGSVCEGSCQVQALWCGQAVAGYRASACSSSTIHTCKRAPCCSGLHRVFKVSSARSVYCGMVECVFVLSLFFCYLLFVFSVVFSIFVLLSFGCFFLSLTIPSTSRHGCGIPHFSPLIFFQYCFLLFSFICCISDAPYIEEYSQPLCKFSDSAL